MNLKEINNKENWESFLLRCKEKTFLDSWNWGEFQKREGNKIWRLGIYDNEQRTMNSEQLIGVALVIKVKAKRGTFLFVPHGPVTEPKIEIQKLGILETLTNKLKEIAKQEKAHFIRIASIWEKSKQNSDFFEHLGFMPAPIHIHPEATWELDIKPSEQELLMNMRKTARYLIRQAQKNADIEIVKTQNIEDLKKFNEIYYSTAIRHKFVPFSLKYIQNQFSSFLPDDQILIFLGKYKNEVVSSAIILFWQNIGFYHHGASLSKYNKIPVSYLLQWEAIKEAKKRECQRYNFWGIAPDDNKNHPWAGLSLFKKGFGGYRKDYVQTQDLPLSKVYALITRPFEKIRKIKRRL
ncbi:peptidoglycan bridge formation glycyltransferase FemA/FemB family protein [Patescibacteria group bacterium]|nr:peptidoglycan bridge formation glycyltransferase FemA/FemB family protein [Patescibacteria group bacterium]